MEGKLNVQTENIFPVIKKFLYSDHEIFLRELISNAVGVIILINWGLKSIEIYLKKKLGKGDD